MINRTRYFRQVDKKPSCIDYKEMREKTITLLKGRPHGMALNDIARACGLSSSRFISLMLEGQLSDLPIGYDRRIDDKLYWVGR